MNMKAKIYKCRNCEHEQEITTAHYNCTVDYCKGCSWKKGKSINTIQFGGHAYRPFICVEKEEQ